MSDVVPPDGSLTRSSLWKPDYVRKSGWLEHAPFAFWLVEALRPGTFVELGTETGFSYQCFCQAVAQLDLPATGYAVDTWRGDEQAGFYGDDVLADLVAYHDPRYASFSRLVRSTFDDAVSHFDDASIDLLHIDGLHTYDAVRHDFDTWRPKLSNRAVVLLHDTNVREDAFGVHRLWRELRDDVPGFEFTHGHGLGVLGVGGDLPPAVTSLLQAEGTDLAVPIRTMYARLGIAIRLEYQLGEARSRLTVARRDGALASDLLEVRAGEVSELEGALAAFDGHLAALEAKVASLEADLQELEPELARRRAELEQDHEELRAALEQEQAELRAALEEEQAEPRAALERELDERRAEVAHTAAERAAYQLHARALEHELSLVLTSTSWHLTKPLRALNSGLRRLKSASPADLSRARRRASRPLRTAAAPPASGPGAARPRVVFVSGEPDTPGHRYRVLNLASSLAPRFFETTVLRLDELGSRTSELHGTAVLWIWRAPYSRELASAIDEARAGGAAVVYDVDDLMFRPDLARTEIIDGIRTRGFSEGAIGQLYESIRRALLEADHCTAPTGALTREIRVLGKPTTVVPNGFDSALLLAARSARRGRAASRDDSLVRIGYAAGSFTHQRDLAVAVPALARVLAEHPEARFVSFEGPVDIAEFTELDRVRAQIELRPMVPLDRLPAEYARFDVNIAPLEVGNPFCEAKSELKYYEAALAGVPTVASPTEPFSAAVRRGETGYLATDERSWYESLSLLVGDRATRERVAEAAYLDALWRFGPERRGVVVNRLVSSLIAAPPTTADLHRAVATDATVAPAEPETAEYDVLYESRRADGSRVGVVVPVFNYGHLLEEALESVRAQTVRDVDLVVVDDCSTDDSAAVARHWLESRADVFNRAVLLRHRRNAGLARTRNAGVLVADTELFLPLDPDNVLLPSCIESTLALIEQTGAAFSFPTIELFGTESGTRSSAEWDAIRLRGGNYIDAMALVRRACWLAVGGYSRLDVDGWEDYDLWCKFVERGFFGAHVPEVTARYRAHPSSMLTTITDVPESKARLLKQFTRRHPWLEIAPAAGRDGHVPRSSTGR